MSLFRFSILCVVWFSLDHFVIVLFAFVVLRLISLVLSQEIGCAERLSPLPSNRHHLSYDDCLEDKREIIRTVLCCVVYDSCTQ